MHADMNEAVGQDLSLPASSYNSCVFLFDPSGDNVREIPPWTKRTVYISSSIIKNDVSNLNMQRPDIIIEKFLL